MVIFPEIQKPVEGKAYGCSDTAKVSIKKSQTLSRILDMLYAAQEAGLDVLAVWETIPEKTRADFNYSKWKYMS